MATVELRGVKRSREDQLTPEGAPEIKRARMGPLAALDKLTEDISKESIDAITVVVIDLLREIATRGLQSLNPSELDLVKREITLVSSDLKTRSTFPKPLFERLQQLRREFHLPLMIDTSKEGIEDLRVRGLLTFDNNTLFFHNDIAQDVTDADLAAILHYECLKEQVDGMQLFDFARYKNLTPASVGTVAKRCPNLAPSCFRMLHEQLDVYCDQKFRLYGSEEVFSVNLGFLQARCPDLFQFFEIGQIPMKRQEQVEIPELDMPSITPDELRFVLDLLTGVQDIRSESDFRPIARLADIAALLGAVTVVKECDYLEKDYFSSKLQDTTLSLEDKMAFLKEIRETLDGRYESLPRACQAVATTVATFLGPVLQARLATALPDEAIPTIHKTFKEVLPFGLTPLVNWWCMVSLIEMFPSKEVRTAIFKNILENVPNCDALLAERLVGTLGGFWVPSAEKMKFLEHFSETFAESFETLPVARTVVSKVLLRDEFLSLCKEANDHWKTDYTPEEAARALSLVRHVFEIAEPFGIRELFDKSNYISNYTGDLLFKTALNYVFANEPAVSLEFGKLMAIMKKNTPSGVRIYAKLDELQDQAAAAGFDIRKEEYSRDDVVRGLAFLTRAVGICGPYGISVEYAGGFTKTVSPPFHQAVLQYLLRDEGVTAAWTHFIETLHQHDPSGRQLRQLLCLYKFDKSNCLKAKELIEAELAKGSDNPDKLFWLNVCMADLLITGGEGIEIDPGRAADFAQRAIVGAKAEFKPGIALVVQRSGRTEDALALLDVNDPLQHMTSLFIRKLRGEAFTINDLPQRPLGPMILWPLMQNVILGEFPKEIRDEHIQMWNQVLLFRFKGVPLLAFTIKEVVGQYPEDAKAAYLSACPDLEFLL